MIVYLINMLNIVGMLGNTSNWKERKVHDIWHLFLEDFDFMSK